MGFRGGGNCLISGWAQIASSIQIQNTFRIDPELESDTFPAREKNTTHTGCLINQISFSWFLFLCLFLCLFLSLSVSVCLCLSNLYTKELQRNAGCGVVLE